MRKLLFCSILLCFVLGGSALASELFRQNVTFQILPITEIWVSGNPGFLVVNTAEAGENPSEAVDDTTRYGFSTNTWDISKKITGKINESMPEFTYLKVKLEPLYEAVSMDVTLTTEPRDLVTGMLNQGDPDWELPITYKFGARFNAGLVSGVRTVTFTCLDE